MESIFYILQGKGKDFSIIAYPKDKKEFHNSLDSSHERIVTSQDNKIIYIGLKGNIDKREAVREIKKTE